VAVLLALVTTLAIVGYLQSLRSEVAVVTPVKTEAVVVARANIAERKVVRGDLLEVRQVPVSALHPHAARRIEDVANRVAVAPIFAEEQVLMTKLAPVGVSVGLAYVLPKDKRAMTIAVNEVVGVAGFVFPGDRVDILSTVKVDDVSVTKIVLQDVEVMAVAQKVDQKPGEDPRVTTSATLALTPEQTEVLAQVDTNGKVRLALRPYGVTDRVQTPGMTVDAAVGRRPAAAAAARPPAGTRAATSSAPRKPVRPVVTAAPPIPTTVHSVELYRATVRSTVNFEEKPR
jgi:pilus assembly protein CpaB